jgi:hypothetical protein
MIVAILRSRIHDASLPEPVVMAPSSQSAFGGY